MALDTVQDYINGARTLLQDTYSGAYRYSDAELVQALNMGLLETRRLRPDLVASTFRTSIPTYDPTSTAASVTYDPQYRVALLYYVCGQAQLRDEENTQDARSAVFLNKFVSQLLTIQS